MLKLDSSTLGSSYVIILQTATNRITQTVACDLLNGHTHIDFEYLTNDDR